MSCPCVWIEMLVFAVRYLDFFLSLPFCDWCQQIYYLWRVTYRRSHQSKQWQVEETRRPLHGSGSCYLRGVEFGKISLVAFPWYYVTLEVLWLEGFRMTASLSFYVLRPSSRSSLCSNPGEAALFQTRWTDTLIFKVFIKAKLVCS